jgi:HK97 family phage major capsid protein
MADISRADVAALIENEYNHVLLGASAASSQALAASRVISLGTKVTNFPVLATLPEAGWVGESATGPEGVKPKSKVTWANKQIVVEEVAVIVPVHEDVLADATGDTISQIATTAGNAIGKKLDQAVVFGVEKPASWTSPALVPAAVAAGQVTQNVKGVANVHDLYGAINVSAETLALDGFVPDTLLASLSLRYRLANIRDGQGLPAFTGNSYQGFDTVFSQNGAWDATAAEAILVDKSRVIIGVRQDITVKFLDQASITVPDPADATKTVQVNLAERDMVAWRFKARYGYVLGTGTTNLGVNKTPVALVTPAA